MILKIQEERVWTTGETFWSGFGWGAGRISAGGQRRRLGGGLDGGVLAGQRIGRPGSGGPPAGAGPAGAHPPGGGKGGADGGGGLLRRYAGGDAPAADPHGFRGAPVLSP